VDTGKATRAGPAGLRLPLDIRSAGDYTVAYHVVFDDGSDLVGALRFSVGTGAPPSPVDNAARARPAAVAGAHRHAVDPLGAALLVVDAAVLLVVVALLLLTREHGAGRRATWRLPRNAEDDRRRLARDDSHGIS